MQMIFVLLIAIIALVVINIFLKVMTSMEEAIGVLAKLRQHIVNLKTEVSNFNEAVEASLEEIDQEFKKVNQKLYSIEALLRSADGDARAIEFYSLIGGQKVRVVHMFLKVSDDLPLSVSIVDAKGNPAKVDGRPQWAVTDEALAKLEVAEDGMSAMLKPIGPIGTFQVQVKADADLGEGVKDLLGVLDIELLAGEAVAIAIAAGEAVPQAEEGEAVEDGEQEPGDDGAGETEPEPAA